MSENENQEQASETVQTEKESAVNSMLSAIASRIKDSNPEVVERWQDAQVEKEVSTRVDLLDKAMQRRFQCLTELNKVNRPDNETFNADGSRASASYSKDRLKAIKDAKEALAKVEHALEKALVHNEWQKIKELKG